MRKIFSLLCCSFLIALSVTAQVGIGTNAPHPKAALEIKATDKGVLFPMMTTAQRDDIDDPPNGLHIFNTDQKCLNYYDSIGQVWNCYCPTCGDAVIYIGTSVSNLDFYASYARHIPASRYIINILPGVTISGGDSALKFTRMISNATITINNYGTIAGSGGSGGNGEERSSGALFCPPAKTATNGGRGGCAIGTKSGVLIIVNNYGVIAGGGGGGGGAGISSSLLGGGGGGGAGITGGLGGYGGSLFTGAYGECFETAGGSNGGDGQAATGGSGGAGLSGGAIGGAGGGRGQAGQTGGGTVGGTGGQPGKAIGGGSGNIINNLANGISFGVID